MLDVDAGEVLADRQVLVDDGAVAAVLGPDEATPADARHIDLSGLTILPGLIDCHSHLVGDMEYAGVPGTLTSEAQEAMTGVRNARATIEAGFTTVRDVGTYRAFVDVALRDAIDARMVSGPRMQCAGAYVTSPGAAATSPDSPATWSCPRLSGSASSGHRPRAASGSASWPPVGLTSSS